MIDTVMNSEAFLIVISGVFIFTLQNLISQLWISPIVEFKKCLAKIETLMARWSVLYKYEYKSNNLVTADGTMDEAIENFKKELSRVVTELIGTYNALPFIEKWWMKMKGIDVNKAKRALLTLSVIISAKSDWSTGESKAGTEINKIYENLKFRKYFTEI